MSITGVCSDKGWLTLDCLKAVAGVYNPPKVIAPATAAAGCNGEEVSQICASGSEPQVDRRDITPVPALVTADQVKAGIEVSYPQVDKFVFNCAGDKKGIKLHCLQVSYKSPTSTELEYTSHTFTPDAEGKLIPKFKLNKTPAGPIRCDLEYSNPSKPNTAYPQKKGALVLHTPSIITASCANPITLIGKLTAYPDKPLYATSESIELRFNRDQMIICDPYQGIETYATNPSVANNVSVRFFSPLATNWQNADTTNTAYYAYKVGTIVRGGYYVFNMEAQYLNLQKARTSLGVSVKGITCGDPLLNPSTIEMTPKVNYMKQYDFTRFTWIIRYFRNHDGGALKYVPKTGSAIDATDFSNHLYNPVINYKAESFGGTLTVTGSYKSDRPAGAMEFDFTDACIPATKKAYQHHPPTVWPNKLKLSSTDLTVGETITGYIADGDPQGVKFYHVIVKPDTTQTTIAQTSVSQFSYSPTQAGLHNVITHIVTGDGQDKSLNPITFTVHKKSK